MRQSLSHRRRLCDKANQAHPPAAPGELERKHPIGACRQLCPQISRRVSALRSAAVCIRCLWPRWLTRRSQLPPSLRRHLRQLRTTGYSVRSSSPDSLRVIRSCGELRQTIPEPTSFILSSDKPAARGLFKLGDYFLSRPKFDLSSQQSTSNRLIRAAARSGSK